MSSLICKCGKEKASTQKKICDDCRKENKRLKSRLDARKHRATHGCVVKNRSPLCSRCKGIKEHQERGYCLACDRERYLEKSKPDCATCGAIKENPRDAYCNTCVRLRNKIKSAYEGRRYKHDEGRKPFCSHCGKIKEENYSNESYCGRCKTTLRRIKMSPEARAKEATRKLTRRAIAQGKLIKLPCEVCQTDIDVHAHHDDYYKPLDVRWLCRTHHMEHHRNNPD